MASVGEEYPRVEGRDELRYPEGTGLGELARDAEREGTVSSAGNADSDNDCRPRVRTYIPDDVALAFCLEWYAFLTSRLVGTRAY